MGSESCGSKREDRQGKDPLPVHTHEEEYRKAPSRHAKIKKTKTEDKVSGSSFTHTHIAVSSYTSLRRRRLCSFSPSAARPFRATESYHGSVKKSSFYCVRLHAQMAPTLSLEPLVRRYSTSNEWGIKANPDNIISYVCGKSNGSAPACSLTDSNPPCLVQLLSCILSKKDGNHRRDSRSTPLRNTNPGSLFLFMLTANPMPTRILAKNEPELQISKPR